jgi:hypothetical protein
MFRVGFGSGLGVKSYLRFGVGLGVGLALGLVLRIPSWLVTFEVSLKARR